MQKKRSNTASYPFFDKLKPKAAMVGLGLALSRQGRYCAGLMSERDTLSCR